MRVPARLRGALRRDQVPFATFRRDLAVLGQDEPDEEAPEFLSPAHPLVEATLRLLRDEATDPAFTHRFDVSVGEPEALVLSFVVRFVDGDGRTVEERLEAVQVFADESVSEEPVDDLKRLGVSAILDSGVPGRATVNRWRAHFQGLLPVARAEAERRAETRRLELEAVGRKLLEEEVANLALWRRAEEERIATLTLGKSAQVTFEGAQAYDERTRTLDREYEARRNLIRDRADVRLTGLELIGGRLIVPSGR